jgi:hypothetical protein
VGRLAGLWLAGHLHNNVHHSFGVPAGDVRGPSAGAPGLHNGNGAEIRAGRC